MVSARARSESAEERGKLAPELGGNARKPPRSGWRTWRHRGMWPIYPELGPKHRPHRLQWCVHATRARDTRTHAL
eukprot:scaffold45105_cov67-Phaeocystis_antarctica.AAC.6